jgi:hypothetical protein
MKTIFIQLTVIFVALAANSIAQDAVVVYPREPVHDEMLLVTAVPIPQDLRNKLYVGLKAGYNYANVYDADGENFKTDPKIGFAAGVFLTVPIGKYFGIQPEVLFSQKGFKASGTLLGNSYSLTRTTNFIDVPLLLVVKPVPFIALLAGPQFSYLVKQRDEFKGEVNSVVEDEFNNDTIRKNMIGFIGGVDFNFKLIVVGTRVGFDVRHNTGDGTSNTPRYKNAWLQATLGLRF